MSETAPHVLVVTSAGVPAATVVPVLAAIEAAGMRVRAIDVGGAGGGGGGMADRVRRALLGEGAERRLRRELDGNPPDVAIAFDPHAAQALTVARDQASAPAPVVAVVSELEPAAAWAQTDADRFVAVDDAAAAALSEHGVEGDRVLVVGPFGERAYADAGRQDVRALRQRFGLTGTPVLIEVAGLGAEVTGQLCLQLSLTTGGEGMTFLFDAGADGEVAAVVRRQVPALGLRGKLFGATADAPLLWRAAELVVARPRPAVVARVLLTGARLLALVDDPGAGAARALAALEARRRAVGVGNLLLLSGALESAVKAGPAPAAAADGADNTADIVFAVARQRHAIIDERLAVSRAATHERVRAASAAVDAAARVSAMPGELEDLGGEGGAAPAAPAAPPPLAELDRLAGEVKARLAEASAAMMAARRGADAATEAARAARAAGRDDDAGRHDKAAEVERARMHALLGELARLDGEQHELARAREVAARAGASASAAGSRPDAGAASGPPPRPAASLDDALADLKRRTAAGEAPPSRPSATPPAGRAPAGGGRGKPDPTVDDELARLKQKLAERKKP